MDELTRLAKLATAGGDVAVSAFVRASQRDVWLLCARLVDAGAAADLTQETYLRALPALRRFRADAAARTWLLAIARHVCIDELRRRYRRRDVLTAQPPESPVDDITGHIDLMTLISSLDPDRRAAFVLTQVIGCTYAETASITDTPIGTVRSRVARARDDLISWTNPAEGLERTDSTTPE